ncbi:hypothetical protein Fmac_012545 [Flemingia macrophylla]|uniref:Uncharacterized protein n=1 Tax=Flemingia macrophylla TaxID=520843 RepID=A0ABD1MQK5_9FABA
MISASTRTAINNNSVELIQHNQQKLSSICRENIKPAKIQEQYQTYTKQGYNPLQLFPSFQSNFLKMQ